MLRWLSIICLLCSVDSVSADDFTAERVIGNQTVFDIQQDKDGFIWVGTDNGLSRYSEDQRKDVIGIRQFQEEDTIYARQSFLKGNAVWFGDNGNLFNYDKLTGKTTKLDHSKTPLAQSVIYITDDGDSSLIIADQKSLYSFSTVDLTFTPIVPQNARINGQIFYIKKVNDLLWIGTFESGFYVLHLPSKLLTQVSNEALLPAKKLRHVTWHNDHYWLGTENGLWILNEKLRPTDLFDIRNNSTLSTQFVNGITATKEFVDVYTHEKLVRIDTKDGTINTRVEWQQFIGASLATTSLRDRDGNLWIGTDQLGLYKLEKIREENTVNAYDSSNFEHISAEDEIWGVTSFEGKFWVVRNDGKLNLFAPATKTIQEISVVDGIAGQDANSSNLGEVKKRSLAWDITTDNNGNPWVASNNGLNIYRYDQETQTATLEQRLFDGQSIFTVTKAMNKAWVVVDGQMTTIDLDTRQSTVIKLPDDNIKVKNILLIEDLSSIWISNDKDELIKVNYKDNVFHNEYQSIRAQGMVKAQDSYWIIDRNRQLRVLDYLTLRENEPPATRLTDNPIISFYSNSKWLWLITSNEIVKLNSKTFSKAFEVSASDFNNISEFNENSLAVDEKSGLLVGGVGGVIHVIPTPLNSQVSTGKPIISNIKVNGVNINQLPDLTQTDNLTSYKSTLHFDYDHAFFNLEFNYVNAHSGDDIIYRYRLNNYIDRWINANRYANSATYSQLASGTYEFEVQASVNRSTWSDSRKLSISIGSPPWLTHTALFSYAILLCSVIVYLWVQARERARSRRVIAENEQRLKQTLMSSGDELWDWHVKTGELIRLNQWKNCDFPKDNIRENNYGATNIHPNDYDRVKQSLNLHLNSGKPYYEIYRLKTDSNKWTWVLDQGTCVEFDEHNNPIRMSGTLKDISQLKITEEKLRLFQRSIETLSDGIFITDPGFNIVRVNEAFCSLTNNQQAEINGKHLLNKTLDLGFSIEQLVSLKEQESLTTEIRYKQGQEEQYFHVLIDAITSAQGEVTNYVGVMSEITQRKKTEQELRYLANYDSLTGLPNRTNLSSTHNRWLAEHKQHALLTMDMDNFKKINDSFNHDVGDHIIKTFGHRIMQFNTQKTLCFRFGGDEFSVLVEYAEISKVIGLAREILNAINHPVKFQQYELTINASIGIALSRQHGTTSQEMLRNADTAMYHAKSRGGDQYQFFNDSLNEDAVRKLQIENLIRHGIKENLFTMFYQPKVNIVDGNIIGMEALVRFEHPEKGLISPAKFIPIAEETGQIIELGNQILEISFKQLSQWVKSGMFNGRVAVNISAHQINQPKFDLLLEQLLRKYDLSAKHVECEITESTLIGDPEHVRKMMKQLKRLGVHLALDDFGTGYSSLAYLTQFPFDTLKIDKTFIDGIVSSKTDRALFASIIDIANNLNLEVVAEGIEDQDQLRILHKYNCEIVQGYLFSAPVSRDNMSDLLATNQQFKFHLSQ